MNAYIPKTVAATDSGSTSNPDNGLLMPGSKPLVSALVNPLYGI
jgi:hypothetical protein